MDILIHVYEIDLTMHTHLAIMYLVYTLDITGEPYARKIIKSPI